MYIEAAAVVSSVARRSTLQFVNANAGRALVASIYRVTQNHVDVSSLVAHNSMVNTTDLPIKAPLLNPCTMAHSPIPGTTASNTRLQYPHLSQWRLPAVLTYGDNTAVTYGEYVPKAPLLVPPTELSATLSLGNIASSTFWIYDAGTCYLFNRLRTDTKSRKRAFVKRGYFRQTRSVLRKENRMKYAYALQGIDYEMIENLKMGEIPDIRSFKP